MPNTLLTIDMITRRAMMVLENNLVAAKFVNREYQDQFALSGAKIGTTLRVRLPNQYVVTKAVTLVEQDTVEQYVPLVVDKQHHVGMHFTQQELTLQLSDFSERIIEPAIAELANDIDQTVLAEYWNFPAAVGVPGTPPGSTAGAPSTAALSLYLYGQANAKLDYEAVPRSNQRAAIVDPVASNFLVASLSGLFHSTTEVEEQYKTGTMGLAIGNKFSMDQNIAVHTVGPQGGAPLVDGIPVEGASSFLSKGWTAAVAPRLVRGDVITLAGVYAVNPRTRLSTGQLRQFVVTANFSSLIGGGGTISISPSLMTTGARQTISNMPADSAPITVLGAAGTVSPQNLVLHKDAITLASVDLEDPSRYGAMAARVSSRKLGISMLLARQYDINSTNIPARVDVLFGVSTLRPSMGCRVVG